MRYAKTRHNLGMEVVQAFADSLEVSFREEKRFQACVAKGMGENQMVHLLLPLTYMNLSGMAVRSYMDYYKLSAYQLVVIVDDFALPFGRLRLRERGSAGGHNGLKSIEAYLGTSDYFRLRMGIGDPGREKWADYVLDPFSEEERRVLPDFIHQGVEVLRRLLKEPVLQVMNHINSI